MKQWRHQNFLFLNDSKTECISFGDDDPCNIAAFHAYLIDKKGILLKLSLLG